MDLTSRRLPLAIIGVLAAILVVQYAADAPDPDRIIDPATCEIYSQQPGGAKEYSGEFDQKCLDVRASLQ